jgi:predicted transcriptional regulator
MTKLLEQAIAKVRELPEDEQDTLAAVMLAKAEDAIREGLAQAERGEFVPDDVVAKANKRHGV